MNYGMFKCVALMGALASLSGYAQVCNTLTLYKDGSYAGRMEESTRSFPEAPEWSTNWGDFDNMQNPYIRLSGMRNYRGDWTGSLVFDALPVKVNGGTLKIKARSSQKGNFGVWLSGNSGAGRISFHELEANKTAVLTIPVQELMGSESFEVDKVGIGLFDVPANQYTNFFVDDIEFSCAETAGSSAGGSVNGSGGNTEVGNGTSGNSAVLENSDALFQTEYSFVDVEPASAIRKGLFDSAYVRPTSAHYETAERSSLQQKTSVNFVLSENEHNQIVNFREVKTLTPKASRDGWYKSLFYVDRNRLKDGVIANPKQVFNEANEMAALSNYTLMPLLLADLDYAVSYCADTACATHVLEDSGLLLAGLPSSYITGSKFRLVYDPYFTVTTRKTLPHVEICVAGKCQSLDPKSEIMVEFDSAGVHELQVKITSGNLNVQQHLFVEVK